MKKNFSTAPRPKPNLTPEQIEAYERGGTGHDANAAPAAKTADEAPAEPTKRLSLDMPESLHRRFKTACSATGTKMSKELLDFIEQRTGELEQEYKS
jgi:hypothetical protein